MGSKLAVHGGPRTIERSDPHYVWPIVTPQIEKAVVAQLHLQTSIYDRSGVIAAFEDEFAAYHGRRHALLQNSGTSALFALYEAAQLHPGDEVLVPAYTFFATVSPLMHTGATPIFCDCGPDGNIDPRDILERITSRTRAVMVTHMWGVPCDMDAITEICREHGLMLFEDCSHAHGARYKNKLVGTFGHAAAWSLQGPKILSGGEGGILLTDDSDLYYRCLLQGHYNKRPLQEIPAEHPLHKFAFTGFGLKFRSHPLAVAMLRAQLPQLDAWIEQKNEFARDIISALQEFSFLQLPRYQNATPAWYGFVFVYDEEKANGISIDRFYTALRAEGLSAVDLPRDTCAIANLPLFKEPNIAMPHLYRKPTGDNRRYVAAEKFTRLSVRMPIWAHQSDRGIVDLYIEGLRKICTAVKEGALGE